MNELIIACVRMGTVYDIDYVIKLRDMVTVHLDTPYTMVCLTDQPERVSGVAFVDISALELVGWWGKLALFEPMWRERAKVVYFDLDVVIKGDITPLTEVAGEFAILHNYPQLTIGKYSSRVMVIGGGMCAFVWDKFDARRDMLMNRHKFYGEMVLEVLYPAAPVLQRLVPKGFFNSVVII